MDNVKSISQNKPHDQHSHVEGLPNIKAPVHRSISIYTLILLLHIEKYTNRHILKEGVCDNSGTESLVSRLKDVDKE